MQTKNVEIKLTGAALEAMRKLDLDKLTTPELLAWYNKHSGSKPVPKFRDRLTGIRRSEELLNAILELHKGNSKHGAAKAKVKAKKDAKAKPAAKKAAPMPPPPKPQPPAEITLVHVGDAKLKRYESKTAPDSKYHLQDRSAVAKPVDLVRCICNDNIGMPRKDIVALCIKAGVNKNTAATQYSFWKKARELAAAKAAAEKGGTPDLDLDGEDGDDEN